MSDSRAAPEFELPNVGPGPDPFGPNAARVAGDDALVLLFQRDYYCGNCRRQVRELADRASAFEAVGARLVSVLPESVDRTRDWQAKLELPYPVLADPDAAVGDEYDQPSRFGVLGNLFDLVGRMPLAAVVDLTGPDPTLAATYPGSSPGDRPDPDELLADCRRITDAAAADAD